MPNDSPAASTERPGFRLEAASVTSGSSEILRKVELELPRAAWSALVGPSGSGKSTLLRLLNRLVEPSEGRVWWAGRPLPDYDVRALRREVALVVQQPRLSPGTAADNLALPVRLGAVSASDFEARAERARDVAGLDRALLARAHHELSGGERLRVALARALILEPAALLLDEPTAALDPRSARRLMDRLQTLRVDADTTLVMVTHRMEDVAARADYLTVLAEGRVAEQGPARELLDSPGTEILADLLGKGATADEGTD